MFLSPGDACDRSAVMPVPCAEPSAAGPASRSAAFWRQMEAEVPFLRRVVRRWHRDRAAADDLVQDTILLALSNAHLWTPGSNLRAWLTTIMRNRFLATLARSARSLPIPADYDPAASPGWTFDRVELRLTLRDTERALQRLPNVQRAVVQTVAIDGNSYEEAAQALGMSAGAVRCHLARARERLRNAVQNESVTSPCATQTARVPAALLGVAMGLAMLLGASGL